MNKFITHQECIDIVKVRDITNFTCIKTFYKGNLYFFFKEFPIFGFKVPYDLPYFLTAPYKTLCSILSRAEILIRDSAIKPEIITGEIDIERFQSWKNRRIEAINELNKEIV